MDPGLSQPIPIDSPSSSDVLRFWEDPMSEYNLSCTQHNPPSSTVHLQSPAFLPSVFSYGTCQSFNQLADDYKLLALDDKLEIEEGSNYHPDNFHDGLVIGDRNPSTSNMDNETNNPSSCRVSDGQLNCVGCQVLREVSHSNGIDITKLQIHGTVGFLNHGIIEVVRCGASSEVEVSIERQLIDFSMHSFEWVKQYLIQYSQMRAQQGFSPIQDTLCAFFDCLCAGMSSSDANHTVIWGSDADGIRASGNDAMETWMGGLEADGIGTSGSSNAALQPSASVLPIEQSGQLGPSNLQSGTGSGQLMPSNEERNLARLPKSNIAAQRQRTVKLKLSDLIDYFHLPIQVASSKLGICSTVLKKICRRNGLKRWPYRKIKSIDRNIYSLQRSLAAGNGQEDASVRANINKLQQQRAQVCAGIDNE